MPILGNPLATAFSTINKQTITGNGTVGPYTLDYAAGSDQDVEVYVNNVRQEPGVAYTVAGTSMTMTGAVQSSDDFYVLFQGKAQQTVIPGANTLTTAMLQSSAVTNAKIDTMAASKLTGALPAIDGSSLTGITNNAGSEYFQVNLTTDQTGLSTNTAYVVDFGGSGTVEYDTASNFDSANDAYLLDSSNGVYMISYSVGIKSPTITSERLISAGACLHIATDGSTFSPHKATTEQLRGDAGDDPGSIILNNSFIYKATTATTKIKLFAHALTTSSQSWHIGTQSEDMMQGSATEFTGAEITFLSVMRIA